VRLQSGIHALRKVSEAIARELREENQSPGALSPRAKFLWNVRIGKERRAKKNKVRGGERGGKESSTGRI